MGTGNPCLCPPDGSGDWSGRGFLLRQGAAGEGGRGDLHDDLIHPADRFLECERGSHFLPFLDGGEQQIEAALEFRAVFGDGEQGIAALRRRLVRHKPLELVVSRAHLPHEREQAQKGQIRRGPGAAEFGDELAHFPALARVAEAVEGVSVALENIFEARAGRALLRGGTGVPAPSGGEITQRGEGRVAARVALPQRAGEIAGFLPRRRRDDRRAVRIRRRRDGEKDGVARQQRCHDRGEPVASGGEFFGGKEGGAERLHDGFLVRLCLIAMSKTL